jgi:hypothetical protein
MGLVESLLSDMNNGRNPPEIRTFAENDGLGTDRAYCIPAEH